MESEIGIQPLNGQIEIEQIRFEHEIEPIDMGSLRASESQLDVTNMEMDLSGVEVVRPDPDQHYYTGRDISFYIKVLPGKSFDFRSLILLVTGPSGFTYQVKQNHVDGHKVDCIFRTLEVGAHIVAAFVGPFTLPGSPFKILLERDYNSIKKAITTVTSEMLPRVGDNDYRGRKPWGITCNILTEQILITDREYHEILAFEPGGELAFAFGGYGTKPGFFNRPTGIAYDVKNKRILVADKDNHRIQVFTTQGGYVSMMGSRGGFAGQFRFPWGIDVSPQNGHIVVADSRNNRIQLLSPTGECLRKFKPNRTTPNGFELPRGVAFDPSEDCVYVTDFNTHSVFRISLDFKTCTKIVSEDLWRPSGIAVDMAGNILVADTRNDVIKVFTSTGRPLQQWITSFGSTNIQVPTDVAVMKAGWIATFDLNGRISII